MNKWNQPLYWNHSIALCYLCMLKEQLPSVLLDGFGCTDYVLQSGMKSPACA